ncbi:GntR family transcriptional regulator [Streptomyces sp. NPDC006365]|uniref:GntR family transcriptional regulator n=1 Tax=Streptomyces sp. NPDC006365 TaxID=3364744 RepID=UPI0036C2E913
MTGPVVRVDTTSQVPPYGQIRTQLAALIRTGRLAEGERLPTVRPFAADLGLSPGTVARAYRELEAAELISARRGAGTQVAPLPSEPALLIPNQLAMQAGDFTTAARALGADTEAILTAVHKALGLSSETVNPAGPT